MKKLWKLEAMEEISVESQDSDTTVSLSSDHPAWSQNQHFYDIVDEIPSDIEDVALHEQRALLIFVFN